MITPVRELKYANKCVLNNASAIHSFLVKCYEDKCVHHSLIYTNQILFVLENIRIDDPRT